MACSFVCSSKRLRRPSLENVSVRNLSKRCQSWPRSEPSTPENKNSVSVCSSSPLDFDWLEKRPITSTPWSHRYSSLDSLLSETSPDHSSWTQGCLTPIQSKENKKIDLNELSLRDIAKNLFDEPPETFRVVKECQPTPLQSGLKWSSTLDKSLLEKSLYDSGYTSSLMESSFLIGKKMGLKKFDVLGELLIVELSLVDLILSYLSPKDLFSVSSVCKAWKEHCDSSKLIIDLRKVQSVSHNKVKAKENYMKSVNVKCMTSSTSPLKEVQCRETQSINQVLSPKRALFTSSSSHSSTSKHETFRKTVQDMLVDESLTKCPRCCSPAKLSMSEQRGECTRVSCMYDFCVMCHTPFHGSLPCRTRRGRSLKEGNGVGSKKSKSNLRRL